MSSFDEVHDWVVVGSGAGSMCSALVMRDAGKSVLVLEKTELLGGSTARSGGVIWIPNNPFMRRDGIDDSEEAGIRCARLLYNPWNCPFHHIVALLHPSRRSRAMHVSRFRGAWERLHKLLIFDPQKQGH